MSGWHRGLDAIPDAYVEAREAVEIAAATGIRGRAVALEDVIVDHMLSASPHARRILEGVLQPLLDYDETHRADLVATLTAYLESGAKLTRAARRLMVHPNTVVYRLRRIHELTGRDPHDMSELLILFLALKRLELTARASDGGPLDREARRDGAAGQSAGSVAAPRMEASPHPKGLSEPCRPLVGP
jgi:DNA-binding PucR family transcriptional regulator